MIEVWRPKDYQLKAVRAMIEKPRAMAWFKPGDGKTSMTLSAFAALKHAGLVNKALLIAPIKVCQDTWPKEIAKWASFQHLTYTFLYGNNKDLLLQRDTDLYIVNFEGLKWLLSAKKLSQLTARSRLMADTRVLVNMGIDMLIVDELSKCKSGSTSQTKLVHLISKTVNRSLGLTGTPAPNSLLDVFWQAKSIDLGEALGHSFTKYRDTYFYTEPYKVFNWKLKPNAEKEIYKRLSNIVIQRNTDITPYAMPELSHQNIYVELPDDVKRQYKSMERHFVTEFKEGKITAKNAAVKVQKLRQIASGGIYVHNTDAQEDAILSFINGGAAPDVSDVRETIVLHTEKAKALAELVEKSNGQPLLVFYSFEHDIDCIKKVLGDVIVLNKEKDTEGIIRHWNEGSIRVMLLHPRSGAHGLNLQMSGGNVCWFTCEWSHELHEQGNRRVWRQGNPSQDTRIYYLLGKDTVDEHVLNVVNNKAIAENNLIKGVEAYVNSLDNPYVVDYS